MQPRKSETPGAIRFTETHTKPTVKGEVSEDCYPSYPDQRVGLSFNETVPVESAGEPVISKSIEVELEQVREAVLTHFPHLWGAVEAGLSICATLLLADNANPVALIYVGPPSAGKTTVVNMFVGAEYNGESICYRSDKFTPASFVSQSGKATKEELEKVDLLPRIRYKVLLTPELATIFRGKQEELAERFSTITRVLDGQGLKTDSGTHGERGYEGDYLFAWLGATTPLNPIVWKVMAQLGSRLFFLTMDAEADPTVEELVKATQKRVPYAEGCKRCQEAVCSFLGALFTRYGGVRRVQWNGEENSKEVLSCIAKCAKLLAVMRTPYDKAGKPQSESAHRANSVLYSLARGHALIHGRTRLSREDVPAIRDIALSSMPAKRRAVLAAFMTSKGMPITIKEVGDAAGLTRTSVEPLMEEMEWLGLARYEREGNGKPSHLVLNRDWEWCASL